MDTTIKNEQHQVDDKPSYQKPVLDVWYAGFWMRLWAFIVDLIVVGSLHRLLVYPVFHLTETPVDQSFMFAPAAIATTIIGFVYFVLMTKFFQQTVGKMVFGLKVVNLEGQRPSWATVIFREVVGKFISKTLFFVGYLAAAVSGRKQAWHDKIADTYVIHDRS
ncbi:RDD family protein [Bacillus tianshenii]|nr:RDD family protein [Bacillus tianshenii]